jgi:hypothetical protein
MRKVTFEIGTDKVGETNVNPYQQGEEFKKKRLEAEEKKKVYESENKGSVAFETRFSIDGAHEEGRNFTDSVEVIRVILRAKLMKAQKIDSTAFISPWTDSLPPLKEEKDVDIVRQDNAFEYLFSARIKKGPNFVRKDVRRGYNQAFSVRIQTASMNQDNGRQAVNLFQACWNKDNEGAVNVYIHSEKVGEKQVKVLVKDINYRPIQGKKMKEIGYLHASVRGMDMDDIMKQHQGEPEQVNQSIDMSCAKCPRFRGILAGFRKKLTRKSINNVSA